MYMCIGICIHINVYMYITHRSINPRPNREMTILKNPYDFHKAKNKVGDHSRG